MSNERLTRVSSRVNSHDGQQSSPAVDDHRRSEKGRLSKCKSNLNPKHVNMSILWKKFIEHLLWGGEGKNIHSVAVAKIQIR